MKLMACQTFSSVCDLHIPYGFPFCPYSDKHALFQLDCRASSTHVIIHSHARGAHASCHILLSPENDIYYLFCRWRGSNLTQRLSSPFRHTWWPTTQGSLWHTMDTTLGNCTSPMSRQMTAERTCVRSTRIQWEVRYMQCVHPSRFSDWIWPTFKEIAFHYKCFSTVKL